MALSRAIVYHALGLDLKNYLATFLRPRVVPTPQARHSVAALEQAFASYMGTEHAVAFPFVRSAVYFLLKSRRFPPGTEIIMPPITIKPIVDAVIAAGLRPVFVDIERSTLCFDPESLRAAITPNTRAALITYLFGIVPDAAELVRTCRDHDLFVIEDFSHNLNATLDGRKLGTFGDVGLYSCSVTKTFDAYGGGLAVTSDDRIEQDLRKAQATLRPTPPSRLRSKILKNLVWNAATQKIVWTLATFPMIRVLRRLNPQMEQKLTGARLGLKASPQLPDECFEQFTERQARVGLALLDSVESQDRQRIQNVEMIKAAVPDHAGAFPGCAKNGRNIYWQFVIYPPDRRSVQEFLERQGIDSGTTNLSLVSSLGIYPEFERPCPNAEYVKQTAMFIPAYPRLSRSDVKRVGRALSRAFAI